jgi:hypothetical protein
MMNARQPKSGLAFALRSCAFALALCLVVAPLGMSCCRSVPCSASQPKGNSDLPCHGSSGSHSHHPPSAAPDLSACHAGEFALEALRMEHDFRKVQEIRGHSASVDALPCSCASLLDPSASFLTRTWAVSLHLEDQSWLNPPLRI